MYHPDILREYSEAVMDFLRGLPPTIQDPGLSLELTLHPSIKRPTIPESSEFFLESDGQEHSAGPLFHWMSKMYPVQSRVITVGGQAYRRAVARPLDYSKKNLLGKDVSLMPLFMFDGEPYPVYDAQQNPVCSLARLGYIVEGFEVGLPEDKREGKNFFLGSVRVVQALLGYTIDVQRKTQAVFCDEENLTLLWKPEKAQIVKEMMRGLEERLRIKA